MQQTAPSGRPAMEPPTPPTLLLRRVLLLLLLLNPAAGASSPPVPAAGSPPRCSGVEREALLQFKAGLRDAEGRLSSWVGRDCCRWTGVSCDNRTGAVVKLDLRNTLAFPPGFGNLSGRVGPSLLQLRSLSFLDLAGNSFHGEHIPPWLGSMAALEHLDLSDSGFACPLPPQLGNLSSLEHLGVSCLSDWPQNPLRAQDLRWLSGLASLRLLNMDGVDLSRVDSAEFLHLLNSELPALVELHLSQCGLSGIPRSLPSVNFTSLAVVDLSGNAFASNSVPTWLFNATGIVTLTMTGCGLQGTVPSEFSELRNLETLFLGSNNFGGSLPASFGKICKLRYLYLSSNKLAGELPKTLEQPAGCSPAGPLSSLVELDLSDNGLSGDLPGWLGELQNIKYLSLESNAISGPLPLGLGRLSELVILDASGNRLSGRITEAHLAGMRNLRFLYISSNPALEANINSGWAAPFKLETLDMGSCRLGPEFPAGWIVNQTQLQMLDLSAAGISDALPSWFWGLTSLRELNLSFNSIAGEVPNRVSGMKGLTSLDLSNNRFSGSIPSGMASMPAISFLNLANNFFSGAIPGGGAGARAFSAAAFRGNPHLCGPPTDAICPKDQDRRPRCDRASRVTQLVIGMALGVALLLLFLSIRRCRGAVGKDAMGKEPADAPVKNKGGASRGERAT